MGLTIGGLGALASGGAAIYGLANGTPSQNVQSPQGYQFQNQSGADSNAYSGIGGLSNYNVAGSLLPQYQQIAQQTVANPYAPGYQQGANATGQAGFNSGANIAGNALSALPDVQSLLSLGFDPQNALYSQLQNQNQQQTNAIAGQYGVQGTPYGAGVADQSNQNFNLAWQNQQLGRATQGAGAAGSLLSQIGGATNTGLNQMTAGSALPYNTFQGINANALNTLGQTGQFGQSASVLPQQQITDYLQYLSGATGQQNSNTSLFGQQLNQANSTFNQQQTLGNNLGSSLAGLSGMSPGSWFGGGGGGFGGIAPTPTSSSQFTGGLGGLY